MGLTRCCTPSLRRGGELVSELAVGRICEDGPEPESSGTQVRCAETVNDVHGYMPAADELGRARADIPAADSLDYYSRHDCRAGHIVCVAEHCEPTSSDHPAW